MQAVRAALRGAAAYHAVQALVHAIAAQQQKAKGTVTDTLQKHLPLAQKLLILEVW